MAAHATYLDQKPSTRRTLETVAWDVVSEYYQEYTVLPTAYSQFLEDDYHAPHLRWWHKNGAGTRADFAVAYPRTEHGLTRLAPFFVDFVLLFANGTLGVFDTKTLDPDPYLVAEHNALHA